jgi:large subunit ribosomal protein L29
LRKLSDADLSKELEETYRRLFTLRMQQSTQQLENHRELVGARRHIARIKTIQREREIVRP